MNWNQTTDLRLLYIFKDISVTLALRELLLHQTIQNKKSHKLAPPSSPAGPGGRGSGRSSVGEPWGSGSGPASRPGGDRRAPAPTWSPGPGDLEGRPAEEWGEGVRPVGEEIKEDRCVYISCGVKLTEAPTVLLCLKMRATK